MTCNHFGQSSIVFGHGLNYPFKRSSFWGTAPFEANFSIRVSSQTPSFYTLRDRGLSYARAEWETVEVSNYRAGTSKLSQYRSLEQSYTVLNMVCMSSMRHSPLQHLASYPPRTLLGVWVTCNDFGQSSIVFGHGLHPRALRHSPLKWTLASAYPPKPLLFDIGAPASVLCLISVTPSNNRTVT